MRRGYGLVLLLSVLGSWTPSAFGQYPYPVAPQPYGGMPMPYAPPPMYGPMPQPGYYPAPMPMPAPRVFVYGPLTDLGPAPPDPTAPLPGERRVQPGTAKSGSKAARAKSNIKQAQMTLPAAGVAVSTTSSSAKAAPVHEACGPLCGDDCCEPTPLYNFIPCDPPLPGHGHVISEVGGYVLVPYLNPRSSFSTTSAIGGTNSEFPKQADFGPFVSLGYIAHNTWGIRADYWYLHGSLSQTFGNANPNTTVLTPAPGGLQIAGPSLALGNGIGVDQYQFWQRLRMDVADVEILKEHSIFDTTLLFGFGIRYARIDQSYSALRNNAGGIDPGATIFVAQDRTDLGTDNSYQGWGPTLSMAILHPLGDSPFSFYTNVRASFLWGTNSADQNLRLQERAVSAAAGVILIDTTTNSAQIVHRQVESGDIEMGLQYGGRINRRLYLYGRAGVVVQRWWNVGNPTASNGNLELVGGVLRMGLAF